ncbi:MAG: hypothetical protein ACRD5R_16155 [Candidatus Acidiferrales bacterium]
MTFTDSEVATLKALLNWWDRFGYVSTAIVFLGCIGEFLAEFTAFPKTEKSKRALSRLSLIVLILGVAGELLGAVRTTNLSGQIIANIEDRAAANGREAAALQKGAEQLRKEAEGERLARVKIEGAVGWRSLSDQQKRDIGKALTRFGNITGVSMWFANGSSEAELFADDIAEALRLAHIHTTTVGGVLEMTEGGGNWDNPIIPVNTGVEIASTTNPIARRLADALMKQITSRGFDATRRADQPTKEDKPPGPIVWVTVQARPGGPQGQYKLQAEQNAKHKSSSGTQ